MGRKVCHGVNFRGTEWSRAHYARTAVFDFCLHSFTFVRQVIERQFVGGEDKADLGSPPRRETPFGFLFHVKLT